jgi:hypothetical protein
MLQAVIRTSLLLIITLVLISSSAADESRALERLILIVTPLQALGDDMIGEPITGTAVLGDTTGLALTLSNGYLYHIYVRSDSFFNIFEFWLTDPAGEVQSAANGESSVLTAYPDSTGEWTFSILLREGASSDTASYAAAIFRDFRVAE